MTFEFILDAVTQFADQAHGDQMRKYVGHRYIVHPLRVMGICREFSSDLSVLSAAILHDVLEDTPIQKTELLKFLRTVMNDQDVSRTVSLVIELTDVFVKTNYPAMNRRLRKANERNRLSLISPDAQTIKYADIMDNALDILNHDRHFAPRFLEEGKLAIDEMKDGHPVLRQRALSLLNEGLLTGGK